MPVNIARGAFAALTLFEVLNYLNIFKLTVVFSWGGLVSTVVVVWVFMELTHFFHKHNPVSWYVAFAGIALDASGDIFKFYATVPHFDKYLHATISGFATIIILSYIYTWLGKIRGWDYWIAWASTMALGGLYEMEEFWESVTQHNNRWGGGADTMTDITANCFGALGAVLVVRAVVAYREAVKKRSLGAGEKRSVVSQ